MKFTNLTSTAAAGLALLMFATGRAAADEDMPATPSSDCMKTFYGIDAAQSAQSGLAQYEAGSGFKHVGASLMADYSINRERAGFASLRYKRLVGDAADSPIVANFGDRDQVSAGIGIKYRF